MTDKLRDALRQYEQIGPSKMYRYDLNLIRDATSALKAERDKARADCAQLVADYGERGDLLAECRVRVSELEAQLAECETVIDVMARHSSGDSTVIISTDAVRLARSLLAKIKARTE